MIATTALGILSRSWNHVIAGKLGIRSGFSTASACGDLRATRSPVVLFMHSGSHEVLVTRTVYRQPAHIVIRHVPPPHASHDFSLMLVQYRGGHANRFRQRL